MTLTKTLVAVLAVPFLLLGVTWLALHKDDNRFAILEASLQADPHDGIGFVLVLQLEEMPKNGLAGFGRIARRICDQVLLNMHEKLAEAGTNVNFVSLLMRHGSNQKGPYWQSRFVYGGRNCGAPLDPDQPLGTQIILLAPSSPLL